MRNGEASACLKTREILYMIPFADIMLLSIPTLPPARSMAQPAFSFPGNGVGQGQDVIQIRCLALALADHADELIVPFNKLWEYGHTSAHLRD